jgi:hypothetical protein
MKILFIGNSFTARNDLPGMIANLAAARRREVEHRLIWAGGASLRMHWNRGEAKAAIEEGGWDYVVLQEQSTLPIKNVTRFHENVRLFDTAIRESGAKTALYMTWARKHEPQNQRLLTEGYRTIGEEIGATIVPVGEAWERALADPSAPVLHDADGSHPSPAGSYLAACVFLSTLCGENPEGLEVDVPGVSAADAAFLQRISRG